MCIFFIRAFVRGFSAFAHARCSQSLHANGECKHSIIRFRLCRFGLGLYHIGISKIVDIVKEECNFIHELALIIFINLNLNNYG